MNSAILHIHFFGIQFLSPNWLWLLLLVPIVLIFRIFKAESFRKHYKFSGPTSQLNSLAFRSMALFLFMIYISLGLGLSFLIMAMALPQKMKLADYDNQYGVGIDIMIAMDVSGSMMATDFRPNRLQAAKEMAKEFIDGRKDDRIGFIAFEGEAYTVCPATLNYDYLKHTIDKIESGKMEPGTAIGTGLGTAVARLRSDSLVSKVIILLTDGDNNRGELSPLAAAELAKKKNIRVYTIGLGSRGFVDMPIQTPFGMIKQRTRSDIDDDLLTRMSELTGGLYFRATDENSLREIYHKIDGMEKQEFIDDNIQREPPYHPQLFMMLGLIFTVFGFVGEQLIVRKNG